MTSKKYLRLTIVSLPLLFAIGFLCAKLLWPYPQYSNITCAPFYTIENCRDVGTGGLYDSVISEHPVWFSARIGEYKDDEYLQNFIRISERQVLDAQIIEASPFMGHGSDVKSFMGSFAGRSSDILLGVREAQNSIITNQEMLLFCSNLKFKSPGIYESNCHGDGWGGPVTYRLFGEAETSMKDLQSSIQKEIEHREQDYFAYKLIMYPIFIYLFFLISLVAWLTVLAVRFVKNG